LLTPEQLAARAGKLTASAVGALMNGPGSKITALWRELIGDPGYCRENLSGVWPIALGEATEALNIDWYERKTGNAVTRRGEVVIHPQRPWAACTLDGWVAALACPIECKHVGGREPFVRILERYRPQMHWQMAVTRSVTCVFSVIEAANPPRVVMVECDDGYMAELMARAEAFMACVDSLTPPLLQEAA
jgi:hypothetical protein